MSKEKNLIEEAIIQMKNLEEAVAENAKGILASTMGQEIKELVKESLEESENDEQEEVDNNEVEVDVDDESSDEDDNEPMDMDTDKSTDSEEVIDLRKQSNSQVLKVFQLMDDNDEVVVTKDDAENIHLKDGQKEYMIVQEGEEDTFESDNMETDMYEMDDMDDMDNMDSMSDNDMEFDLKKNSDSDIEKIVSDVFGSEGSVDEDTYEQDMQEDKYDRMGDAFMDEDEVMYEIEVDEQTDEQDMTEDMDEEDMDEDMYEQSIDEDDMDEDDTTETVYEIKMDEQTDEQDMTEDMDEDMDEQDMTEDMDEDMDEQDMTEDMDEDMDEQDMTEDMDEDMYEQSMDEDMYEDMYEQSMDEDDMEEGLETSSLAMESKMTSKPKGVGMGSPKFKYSSKPNTEGGFKVIKKKADKTMGTGKAKFEYKKGENMQGKMKPVKGVKKMETKEASRTLGAGRFFGKKGLPKPKAAPRHLRVESVNTEVRVLREKNEEYRKALNVFRSKLNEVAIFNSNLAYATRLFTEHTTSKQEKINILRRFDGVESLKESKNLYRIIKDELSNSNSQPMNESFERIVENTQASGSVNLIESKTYENPQFLRMKDLMNKIK
jgi:hypothetical protein